MPGEDETGFLFWFSSSLFLLTGVGQQLLWNEFNQTGAGERTDNCLNNFTNYIGSVILILPIPSLVRQFEFRYWYFMLPHAMLDIIGKRFFCSLTSTQANFIF